jgi:hypothetical protein
VVSADHHEDIPEDEADAEKARVNLIVEKDLVDWVHMYAARRGTSLSALVRNFFHDLRVRESLPDVRQI